MFSIEDSPTVGVVGDKKWVVDHSRDIWMQRVSSYMSGSVDALQLHVGERVFLVERSRWQTPEGTYASRIESLGLSPIATAAAGIRSDRFASGVDRRQVGLIAAEAILVYGSYYNGSADPSVNGQTVEFDERTYTLAQLLEPAAPPRFDAEARLTRPDAARPPHATDVPEVWEARAKAVALANRAAMASDAVFDLVGFNRTHSALIEGGDPLGLRLDPHAVLRGRFSETEVDSAVAATLGLYAAAERCTEEVWIKLYRVEINHSLPWFSADTVERAIRLGLDRHQPANGSPLDQTR